jgi:pimeloyl-ACP methyl ester carboxylesterase
MEQDPSLNNLVHGEGYRTGPEGAFGHVEKRGTGPLSMVLVPGGGFGWEVFESFMDRHESEFTMYAVSLAGMGRTPAPPMPPEGTSYGEQTWIRGAIRALVGLIEDQKLPRPLLLTHFLEGSQIGLRMAIDHPDVIRGVVLFSGSAKFVQPGRDFTREERVRYMDERMAPNWFKTVTLQTWNDNNFPASTYSRDPELGARLFDQVSEGPLPVVIRYLLEFHAADLSAEFADIKAPLLLLGPAFPEAMLKDEATSWLPYFFTDGWKGVEQNPVVENVVIDDARIFVWLDQPERVDLEIARFLEALSTREATPPKIPRSRSCR